MPIRQQEQNAQEQEVQPEPLQSSQENLQEATDTPEILTPEQRFEAAEKKLAEVTENMQRISKVALESERKNVELSRQLTESKTTKSEPPPPAPAVVSDQEAQKMFFQNPVAATRDIVAQAVRDAQKETAAPINDLVRLLQQDRQTSSYDRIKNGFKAMPQYKRYFDIPEFEQMLDNAMAQTGSEPNEQSVRMVLWGIRGGIDSGDIPVTTQPAEETVSTNPRSPNIPAHIRPSAPRAQPSAATPKNRALTENERTVLKANGWNPDNAEHVAEYFRLSDLQPHEVVTDVRK